MSHKVSKYDPSFFEELILRLSISCVLENFMIARVDL